MEDTRFDKLEIKVDDMGDKIEQIYDSIVGNSLNPQGIVQRLTKIETEQEVQRLFRNRVIWTIATLMTIAGVIGFLAKLLFNYITGDK